MKIVKTDNYELIARLNEHVHNIHVQMYPEYFKDYNYEEVKNFFQSIIENPNYTFLLLEDDGRHIGYAWIEIRHYPENAFKKPYQSVYVHQISVFGSYRNRGYGSALMEEIYTIAKKHNIDKIELDYWAENYMAANFYKKQGFKKYREFVYNEV